jgi:hypothetical protein
MFEFTDKVKKSFSIFSVIFYLRRKVNIEKGVYHLFKLQMTFNKQEHEKIRY